MNHVQKPLIGAGDAHKRLWRSVTVALVLALTGAVLGSAILLTELYWKIDEATTTTVQASNSNSVDKSSQTTR